MQSAVHRSEVPNPDFLMVLKVGPEQWRVLVHRELKKFWPTYGCGQAFFKKDFNTVTLVISRACQRQSVSHFW